MFHSIPERVVALVMNALQSEILHAAREQATLRERDGKLPYLRVPAPPDGYCAYHSVVGSLTYSEWSKVKRHSNGVAVNARIEQSESSTVKSLRQTALAFTPQNDVILAEQAMGAQQSTTLDVGELSWLGESLGVSIRCTIAEEARCRYSTVQPKK